MSALNEELNAKVAELCGWRVQRRIHPLDRGYPPGDDGLSGASPLPSYTSDLNAIVAVCRELSYMELTDFAHELRDIMRRDMTPEEWDDGSENWWSAQFANATAHQRCEAFVRMRERDQRARKASI